jgi:hypothetical protein
MVREKDPRRSPRKRPLEEMPVLKPGQNPENSIAPLSPELRAQYPHVIFELATNLSSDYALMHASYGAMVDAQLPVQLDLEGEKQDVKAVVRSGSKERWERTFEGALFLGLTEATRARVASQPTDIDTSLPTEAYDTQTQRIAKGLLSDLTSKPKLYEAFQKYYGGLRWGPDQEKFLQQLFAYGTDYSPALLDQTITSDNTSSLVYRLELEEKISYDQRKDWYQKGPEAIFKRYPELDYRRLEGEKFRATPEGQKLLDAYTRLCGEMLARQHERSFEGTISKDGKLLPIPSIPLTRHPIVEALVIDELAFDKPKPKYDFGPEELTGIALDSDSKPAHAALIRAISTRLREEDRRVFDGPDEFRHKHRNIWEVLAAYKKTYGNEAMQGVLRDDVLKLFDAFTGDGEIATSVRQENAIWKLREMAYRRERGTEVRDSSDVHEIRDIAKSLIKVGITSPDFEVIAAAEGLIERFVSGEGKHDVLAISIPDLKVVLIDAIKEASHYTHTDVFERNGALVFESEYIANN